MRGRWGGYRLDASRLSIERSTLDDATNRDRVAVVAQWSPGARQSVSLHALVSQLASRGYGVLVVSTSDAQEPLSWPGPLPGGVAVVRRPNRGYDFGSWAMALRWVPDIARRSHVLLLNDSMVGPFAPLDTILAAYEASAADVWGLTSSEQFGHHLQSYLLGFRNGILADPWLRQFWAGVRDLGDKAKVIAAYELGLSRGLLREGYCLQAHVPSTLIVEPGENPVITGWRALLDRGVPLVKRELLRAPSVAVDASEIPAEVRERYGVEVSQWL